MTTVPHVKAFFPCGRPKYWIDNCVVVVSGASSGIGKQIALLYASRRCRLVLIGRRQDKLEEIAQSCRAFGSEALVVPCDMAIEPDCKKVMDEAMANFGRIDILVICSGVGCHHSFRDNSGDAIYRQLMDINFFGYLHLMKAGFTHLAHHTDGRRGLVIVVSAISGELGLPFRTALCASKFAVTGFFESLRAELHDDDKLDICIVCPPSVCTNFRRNCLKDENAHIELSNPSSNPDAISAYSCAKVIVDAADRRLRKVYFPFKAYLGVYLRPFFPDLVDKQIKRKAKL
uniref:Uncharacterized protein n=1 Tax=Spongospora subterranea TaxID=70186 RepID=A0A0H5QNW3_9EUKA|eukprot:CRZ03713.1 hypothetical protein [Spongospora subterranea]